MKNFIDWLRDDWKRGGGVAAALFVWLVLSGAGGIMIFILVLLAHLLSSGSYVSLIVSWFGVPVMFVLIAYILRDKEN